MTTRAVHLSVISIQMCRQVMPFDQYGMRSTVYIIHSTAPRTEPGGIPGRPNGWPTTTATTYCARPKRYDPNHRYAIPSTPNVCCKRLGTISWSTVDVATSQVEYVIPCHYRRFRIASTGLGGQRFQLNQLTRISRTFQWRICSLWICRSGLYIAYIRHWD